MSSIVKKLMVRVIVRRMAGGESFDNIVKTYPGLTLAEVKELREAVGE